MQIVEVQSLSNIMVALEDLLIDSIRSGASVGFLLPVDRSQVHSYWQSVEAELASKTRNLFLAMDGNEVVGCVQLSLCSKANGSHRGEVEKLMVHTRARGQGISKQLMAAMENSAVVQELSLLVLDTRFGDTASSLYRSIGYTEVGQIPKFARSSSGELEATVYFYKIL